MFRSTLIASLVTLVVSSSSSVYGDSSCNAAHQLCTEKCASHGWVQRSECWGSPDHCALCLCGDGTDFTKELPVKCERTDCGYDCPTYAETCAPSQEDCGDWGVPCCHDYTKVCDYSNRDPKTGTGECLDLTLCPEDSVVISGVPKWRFAYAGEPYNNEFVYDLNGVYNRKTVTEDGAPMEYAKYEMRVGDELGIYQEQTFMLYPYAAGSNAFGWTLLCEDCGYLWLFYSTDPSTDITAVPPTSWKFQGNGGSSECVEDAPGGACWHGTDLTSVQISCASDAGKEVLTNLRG